VKERILNTLKELQQYALGKGVEIAIDYHEEDSQLMRFANSAISLNTNEHLIRLDITAQDGRRRATYGLITNLDQLDDIKVGIDTAAEMVVHAQPLGYDPSLATFTESFADESAFDPDLAAMPNEEKLAYFNTAVKGLESDEVRLGGIFSCGEDIVAQINTRSEHTQFFRTSDAQVSIVLAHTKLKWEVQAEQSAQSKADLDPEALHAELAFLLNCYQTSAPVQLPLGRYDIVFGSAAIADLLMFMNWIAFNGGSMKRGFSMLPEDSVGKKVLSDKFTLVDDPSCRETFPYQRDFMGMARTAFPLFKEGVFEGFTWYQDDADEFGAKPTGHTVGHKSLVLHGGGMDAPTLEQLAKQPRENDILYVPFLHYTNIVNPTKGLLTGSSRFGALLLKKDGTVVVPYNVRLTQSLFDLFGDKVAWLSKQTVAYNTSQSYGARNPTATIVPRFVQVNDLEISHSNSSY
jgi:predicted Zn-dependent protease